MAILIRHHHREAFSDLVDQLYRLRRRVFVERLKWALPEGDGVREIDQFDSADCLHLVVVDDRGRVRATSRVTPSLSPNVTCDRHLAYPAVASEDPARADGVLAFLGARSGSLEDPAMDPTLLARFARRATA